MQLIWLILGWATVAAIGLTAVGTAYAMWVALAQPWRFRRRFPVPREVEALEWTEERTIPWI